MRSIQGSYGRLIAEATGGDAARSALLAALAASESGGNRQAYRFVPANHQRLLGLLSGDESRLDGLTRAQLEKRLDAAGSQAERQELLKRLAGLHGYTQIAGYHSIVWKEPLEALAERARHFSFAALLLDRLCREFELDPAWHATELGRRWNAGLDRSAIYVWRLEERMRLYREVVDSRQ